MGIAQKPTNRTKQIDIKYFALCEWIERDYIRLESLYTSITLANYVADMSPTHVNIAKSWPTLRVVATQKRDTNAQFISITADKYKSAQKYFFVRSCRHATTCWQKPTLSCRFGHPADKTFYCVCDMTSDVSQHVADTTQNVAVWATKTTRRHPT